MTRPIRPDLPADPLDRGIALFNAGRWFEAHESFEDLWRAAPAGRGEVWKGLAQVCAGFVKLDRGEPASAAVLIQRGLGRLEAAPDERIPLDLPPLVSALRGARDALLAGARPAPPRLLRRHPV